MGPAYQFRPLPPRKPHEETAAKAIRQIGTNALPKLLDVLAEKPESRIRQWLRSNSWRVGLPNLFVAPIPMWQAAGGVEILGTNAIAAVTFLERMMQRMRPDSSLAARALAAMGDPGRQVLIRTITGTNAQCRDLALWAIGERSLTNNDLYLPLLSCLTNAGTNLATAMSAAWTLSQTKLYPNEVAIHIARFMTNNNWSMQGFYFLTSLPPLGEQAKPVIPFLLDRLNKPESREREHMQILSMLGELKLVPELCVPAIHRKLKEELNQQRWSSLGNAHQFRFVQEEPIPDLTRFGTLFAAIRALGEFGPCAKTAFPDLMALLPANDKFTEQLTKKALMAIDAEAAAKAGIN